jgi:hypothetical protein
MHVYSALDDDLLDFVEVVVVTASCRSRVITQLSPRSTKVLLGVMLLAELWLVIPISSMRSPKSTELTAQQQQQQPRLRFF